MKISLTLFLLPQLTGAFTMAPVARVSRMPSLQMSQLQDIEEAAVSAALAATKKFGATSKEAQVAWDNVEELRAAESHTGTNMAGLDTECETTGPKADDCADYDANLQEMEQLKAAYNSKLNRLQEINKNLSKIKMPAQKAVEHHDTKEVSAAMQKAEREAKEASAKFGPSSPEAALAWETYEELAAAGLDNAMGEALSDEECSLEEEAMEACMALEELSQALNLKKQAAN